MAEENSDKKKIAELYFGYDKAYKGLETIDKKLKELSDHSEDVFGKIQKGMEKSFNVGIDYSKIVNTDAVKKSLDKVTEITESQAKRLTTTINNEAIKTTGVKNRENAKRETIEKNAYIRSLQREEELDLYKEKLALKEEYRNNRLAKSTESMYDKISNYAKTYLIYQGFNVLKNEAKELVDEMVNVENQMVQIDRVLNDNSLNIDNYRDKLIKLAYDYGNSFENVADVTLRLAQAGFDADQSLALTEKTLLALNTAELNATEATDDMVAVMSQWNLMTGDATKVSEDYATIIDKVNRVADNFPTTSADILDALKKTSSAFNIAGASIDETIATIVAAEKASQRGGKVIGTALNNIVQQLKDSKKLATMEAMGLDIYTDSAKTEFKSVIDILSELSAKMEQLKNEGKENTVEMQELLSVFTLFRRNIGSSLLGEMAGENSTYQQVLDMVQAYDTIGYSLQENEKYMKTAKAAQEQFNTSLLELKTKAWDQGGEQVFRSLLMLGNDVVKVFGVLIDTFGTLPTTIGIVTLAFSLFNKELQAVKINEKGTGIELTGFLSKLKGAETQVKSTTTALKGAETATVGLKVATVALNAAWSLGLSLAITYVISELDKLIHAEENARKKSEELIQASKDTISANEQESQTIEKLIKDYEEYANAKKEGLSEEELADLTKKQEGSQKAISEYLIQNNKYTKEMVGNYELQLKTLKEITEEKRKQNIEEQKAILEESKKKQTGLDTGFFYDFWGSRYKSLKKAGIDLTEYNKLTGQGGYSEGVSIKDLSGFGDLDFEKQLDLLTKWKEQLKTTGKDTSEAYTWVEESLNELQNQSNDTDEAVRKLNEDLINQKFDDFLDEHNIETIEDYKKALEDISNIKEPPEDYIGSLEDFQAIMQQMLENTFPSFSGKMEEIAESIKPVKVNFNSLANKIETLSSQFDMVTKAANEFNSEGAITASTFKKIIDNNLLQYLDIVNGKMVVSKQYFEEEAEALRRSAEATLKEEYAKEILQIVTGSLNKTLEVTKTAAEIGTSGVNTISEAVINSANDFLKGKDAANQFNEALSNLAGKSLGNIVSNITEEQKKQLKVAENNYNKRLRMMNSLASGVTKASKAASSGSSKASKDTTKTFEEQSQERVKIFKQEIDDLESLEKSWVNKYKKLELFSTSDLKFITHQRINRFNEYLNQINQIQGISEKDRTDLIREYSSKRQEAELEYFDLLKDQLDNQIKELQNANKERIQQIKDTAQAQIDALKKVEKEDDRIKQKEEYYRKREELIHGNKGIEYWQQRTGREAQIALAEAQQELEDLDKDWEEKKKEWNLDDQVEQIEKARDVQIEAIEDAQEKQIQGWKSAYDAQVQLYAQTGQIIYDDSVINAGYLYNAYMDNFVTPFHSQLQNVMNTINAVSTAADNAISKVGGGSSGGGGSSAAIRSIGEVQGPQPIEVTGVPTWSDIQSRATTATNKSTSLVDKVKQAASKATTIASNITTTFKKLIGKAHSGGEIRSSTEGLVLLKPKEVVLTPEWAAGMNKLIKQINDGTFNANNGTTNNIDIQGNLVNLDAKINNRQDADYLTEKIEKILKDKFNIKK